MSLPSFFRREAAPAPPARITIRRRLLGHGSRLRSVGLAAGLLGLGLASVPSARAATCSWNGVPGDWFSNPSNWTLGGLPSAYPGAGDDAQNLSTAAMTLGQSTTVNSFLSDGAFTLNGGQFSGNLANAASTLQVNNTFKIDGGQVNNFTIQAGVQQAGQPAPSVIFTTNGGNSLSNTVVNANLDLATNSNAYVQLFNTNTINGAISLGENTGGNGLHLYNSASNLVIGSTGSLTGFGFVVQDNGGSTVTNNGLFNANNAANALTLGVTNFNNNGTLEATNGGSLAISNTSTGSSGAIKAIGAGSVVTLTNGTTFTGSGTAAQGNLITASGGGKVIVDGASLLGTLNTAPGTALIFTTNGNNSLSNATVNGSLDLATSPNAYLRLFNADTVNGNISLGESTGGNGLHLYNSAATLTLNGTLAGFGYVVQDNGGATVANNGTINANSSGNTLITGVTSLNNNVGATLEATNGGVLAISNTTTTNYGAVAATGGGVINLTAGTTFVGNAGSTINTVGGTFNVTGATLLGTLKGAGASSLVFDTNGANLFDNTTANINLDLATRPNAYLRLFDTDTINGSISLGESTGGNGLHLYNSASNLVLGSTSTLQGFGYVVEDNGGSTVANNGLINANSAAGLTLGVTNFNNNVGATTEATGVGGVLNLSNTTTTNYGAVAATGGGVINLTAGTTFVGNAGSTINTVGGTFNVTGATLLGTLKGAGTSTLVFDTNGANNFNGTTASINLDLATNTNAYLRLFNADTVNGAISLGEGPGSDGLHLYNSATTLTLNNTLTGFGFVVEDNGGSTVTNNSTINANNAAGLTLGVTNFNNNAAATTEATNGGVLNLSNTFTGNSGALKAVGAGSTVNLTNGTTFTGTGTAAQGNLITASGGGKVVVDGVNLRGTLNMASGTALIFTTNGNNNLDNTTVNGSLDLATNSNAYARLFDTDTVNGAISLGEGPSSDGLHLYNSAANLVINNSLTGFGFVIEDNGGSTVTNNGTINANSSGNTLVTGVSNLNNNNTLEATGGGILNLSNTFTGNSGALKAVGAGSTVNLTNGTTFTGSGTAASGNLITASGGGKVVVDGVSLLGTINTAPSTALILTTNGNNALSNTTVNGSLDLATNSNAYVRLFNTDTVNGAISLGEGPSSDGIHLYNSAANLVLGSAGTLQGFGYVIEDNGGATVTNNGLINANAAGQTLNIATSNFNNTGTAQATSGATLNVSSLNATNSGAVNVMPGGTATFSNGLTQTAGATRVFGTLNASETVNGGLFVGNGQVVGNIVNAGGEVQSVNNNSGGSLNISGNFSQGSGGTLDVIFGNNFHSLLTVTGQTTLGGTLSAFDLEPVPFTGTGAIGSQFAFLDYSGTLAATGTSGGFTQYFSNETPLDNNTGLITGPNGFQYELINDTKNDMLDLKVVTAGSPVPEASTTVSFGLLLLLGLGGAVVAARRKKA